MNIYSSNATIKNKNSYNDLIEDRFNKSFTNIYNIQMDNKRYSDRVIDKNNLEFFTVDDLDNQFSDLKFDNKDGEKGNDESKGLFDVNGRRDYGVSDNLTHNNMVPHFKMKGNYGLSPDAEQHLSDTFTRKLNLFTGSMNDPSYKKKTERKPLFNPTPGVSNVYGVQNRTEFFKGRYIPGRERRNEKPFQEVKITPGLNLGYNEVGIQGRHDFYRALPKTIDQTRSLSNQRITYNNPMGGEVIKSNSKKEIVKDNDIVDEGDLNNVFKAMNEFKSNDINGFYAPGGGKRTVDPVVVKRHPDRFKAYGYERHLPTSANYSKAANYGEVEIASANRGLDDTTHAGPAKLDKGHIIGGEVESNKEQYLHSGPSNVFSNIMSYVVNYLGMTPAPTNRDMLKVNETGNIKGDNHSYVINYDLATPDMTNRDIFKVKESGNVSGDKKPYVVDYEGITPAITNRDLFKVKESGNMSGDKKPYVIDYSGITPTITNRDMFKVKESGNMSGDKHSYVINYELATPSITNRDMFKVKESGNISGNKKAYIVDYEGITPIITNRDMFKVKESGNVSGDKKSYVIDYDEVPDPTNRDMYKVKDSFIGAKDVGGNKEYVINYDEATPDPTNRDTYNVDDSFRGAKGHNEQRNRRDALNMRTNEMKDNATIKPHGPVKCNYSKIPTMENTEMTSNYHKLQINRELYPDIKQLVAGMDYPIMYDKKTLPNDEFHWNSYINENLQGNPYVNNTQDKSDYYMPEV